VTFNVKNVGSRDGEEIVQMYIRDEKAQVARPVKELKGFKRVFVKAGESVAVQMTVTPEMLSFHGLDMKPVVEPGDFTLMVGSSSEDSMLKTIKFTYNE
jgi:beta-glucosidase